VSDESFGSNSQPEDGSPAAVCAWSNCAVCAHDTPYWLMAQSPTWTSIMRVVFYALSVVEGFSIGLPHLFHDGDAVTGYFVMRKVYDFIEDHWDKLCPHKNRGGAWKKQLQDALSHNKQYFVSGMDIYQQKGYWGLRHFVDPWSITGEEENIKKPHNVRHNLSWKLKKKNTKKK